MWHTLIWLTFWFHSIFGGYLKQPGNQISFLSILTVKFGLNCMIFHETTLYISVNFSQCLVLPEPIFFPIKGDTYTLQKNDIRPFALFCIICKWPKFRKKSEILLIFWHKIDFFSVWKCLKRQFLTFFLKINVKCII